MVDKDDEAYNAYYRTIVAQNNSLSDKLDKIKKQLAQCAQLLNANKIALIALPQRLHATHKNDKPKAQDDLATVTPIILLVEDNLLAQKASQSLLTQLACHVDVADSGKKAILLFEPGKYDLIFMDIGLNDTSGYVLSKNIRHIEKNSPFHVPIIALTGFDADTVKSDCSAYSMAGAMTKPLTQVQAKQIIAHYIYHDDTPIQGLKTSTSML